MANVKTVFLGTELEESQELQCFLNQNNNIYIEIKDNKCENSYNIQTITLDIPTAIKLSKVLRNEIRISKDNDEFERLSKTF